MLIFEDQIDALKEIVNIGIGKAANTLNMMTGKHIELHVPEVKLLLNDDLINEINDKNNNLALSSINLNFKGTINGSARLIFPTESASKLVATFTDESDNSIDDLDTIRSATLSEIGNIVLNSLIGTISNLLKINLTYTPPNYSESPLDKILSVDSKNYEASNLFARTKFSIAELQISGDFVLFFAVGSLDNLLKLINENFDL